MKPSETVRQKLIEAKLITDKSRVVIEATRFSTYRREFGWLPRTRIIIDRGVLKCVYLSDFTVTELSKMKSLTVNECFEQLYIEGNK